MPPKYSREISLPIVWGAHLKEQFRTSPCEASCPAGNSIQKMQSLLEQGNAEEALRYLRAKNPFPGITGRVCPHFCMAACNRSHKDSCVNIRALERAAATHASLTDMSFHCRPATGKKVSVIGGGPAGLTAAYYLALLGHAVTIYEAEPVLGGVPRYGVPHFRLPRHVVDREVGMILQTGVRAFPNTRVGKDISFNDVASHADAVVIATGTPGEHSLPVAGAEHALKGVAFLRSASLGLNPTVGDSVVVMGGGGVAFDCAFTARRQGAKDVHIICLEKEGQMRAPAEDLELAAREGIHLHTSCTMSGIRTENGAVKAVDYFEVKECRFDAQGKLFLDPLPGGEHSLPCDTVIFAVGMKTDLSFLPENSGIEQSPRQWVCVDAHQHSARAGVFACGDVATGPASIARAIGTGRHTAFSVHAWLTGDEAQVYALNEGNMLEPRPELAGASAPYVVQYTDIYGLNAESSAADAEKHNPCAMPFAELRHELTLEQAQQEAARCLHCGHCKACGTCVDDCPGYVLELRPYGEAQRPEVAHGDECWHCANCRTSCPCGAIGFSFPLRMQV